MKIEVANILNQLALSEREAINRFYAQIELRKVLPFPLSLVEQSGITAPIEHVARMWDQLDQEDFSKLV